MKHQRLIWQDLRPMFWARYTGIYR